MPRTRLARLPRERTEWTSEQPVERREPEGQRRTRRNLARAASVSREGREAMATEGTQTRRTLIMRGGVEKVEGPEKRGEPEGP